MSISETCAIETVETEWTTLACRVFLTPLQSRCVTINVDWVTVGLEVPTEEFNEVDLSNDLTRSNWINDRVTERSILDAIAREICMDRIMDGEVLEEFEFQFNYMITAFKEVDSLDCLWNAF